MFFLVRQITTQRGKLLKINNSGTSKTSVGNVCIACFVDVEQLFDRAVADPFDID